MKSIGCDVIRERDSVVWRYFLLPLVNNICIFHLPPLNWSEDSAAGVINILHRPLKVDV